MRDWTGWAWAIRLVVFLAAAYLTFGLLTLAINRMPVEAMDSTMTCPTR